MTKTRKRIAGWVLAVLILNLVTLAAASVAAAASASTAGGGASVVIAAEVNAVNRHEWAKVPDFWVSAQRDMLNVFLNDEANQRANEGYFNVEAARIVELKELPVSKIRSFTPVDNEIDRYGAVKVFYVGIEYRVRQENKYYYNGVNYRLATVVPEGGRWKIAEMADLPVDTLVKQGDGFGSASEQTAVRVHEARQKGVFLNASGKVIENLAASEAELRAERSASQQGPVAAPMTAADHLRPSSVRVYLTSSANRSYYGCSTNCVRSVDFYSYVKNVLPNEWGPSWNAESLKAGAECVKMYGWYAAYYPLQSQIGADVYDNDNDQVYLVNSALASTTSAIDAVGGEGMQNAATGSLFLAHYVLGNCAGGQNGGWVYQAGTKCLADAGRPYDWILHFYYDYSLLLGYNRMGFFSY